jgi:hypothetical protein
MPKLDFLFAVKWDQLICQNPQLQARKIRIRVAAVRRIRRSSR